MWLGSLSKNSTIHIIGAGISGLLAGHYLKKAGFDFKIWESSSYTGGKIRSYYTEFGLVETAANAILLDQNVEELLNDLKLSPIPAKKKLSRFIADKTNWHHHLKLMFHFMGNLLLKGLKPAQLKNQNHFLTLNSFFTPLLGVEHSMQLLSAISRGVYARNSNELSLDAFFNIAFLESLADKKLNYFQFFLKLLKYKKKNKTYGSISFKNGMQELITTLTHELHDHLNLNVDMDTIQTKINLSNTLFCTPPQQVAELLIKHPTLAAKFKSLPMTSLQSMTVFTDRAFKKLENSFGVLITPNNVQPFLGILAQSEIFPGRVKNPLHHCYTLIGNIIDADLVLNSFCKFAEIERKNILEYVLHPWKAAIPVYDEVRYKIIQEIKLEVCQNSHQMFFGNYIDAIGLKDLVSGAKNMAQSISLNAR